MKDVIAGSWAKLCAGTQDADGKAHKEGPLSKLCQTPKTGSGKIMHGFKVVGENRIMAVIDGGVESAVSSLSASYGDKVEVTCTPLRSYQSFAKNVLGVDESLTKPLTSTIVTDGSIRIFLLHFVIEYRGLTPAQLLATWKNEAEFACRLRNAGKLHVELFKVVAQREVYCFINVPDGDTLDDISFTLPLIKELGDQVKVTTKALIPFTG